MIIDVSQKPYTLFGQLQQRVHVLVQVGQFLLQFSNNLARSKQEGQAETVDLHALSVKEARAAVLCVLCNIQVGSLCPLARGVLCWGSLLMPCELSCTALSTYQTRHSSFGMERLALLRHSC